jgi:REP element-mobilizing transposase RayT
MSSPRPIFPNTTYTASRRTTQRRFLLRPDPAVNDIFLYCLAYAVRKHGVLIHAWITMSNHHHVAITDVRGNLPDFMACLDRLVARAVNCFRGRWENLFAPGSYGAAAIIDPADVIDKLVYILANPVAAGIVSHSNDWRGASSRGWRFGEKRTVRRPAVFFDAEGGMPSEIPLTLSRPPGLEQLGPADLDADLRRRLIERETAIRAEFQDAGRSFMGMAAAMRVSPDDTPNTVEPRRTLNPRFACRDTDGRITALRGYTTWLLTYRAAYREYRRGNLDALFPDGTYLMRIHHHVRVGAGAPETVAFPPPPPG